jgi:hypothetical protein
MTADPGVTRFYQGARHRGRWCFYSRGYVGGLIRAEDLTGRMVNMSTTHGMVYDRALVTAFDSRRGVLTVEGGLRQSVTDARPVPTGHAEVFVEDIARGFIHALPDGRVAPLQVFLLNSYPSGQPQTEGSSMTDTTTAEGTELAQVAPGALARVKGLEPWTVTDLAGIIAGPAPTVPKDQKFPDPAPAVRFTDALRSALKALPAVFGKVTPTECRSLEQSELTALTAEVVTIDQLTTELGERRNAIAEYIRTHQDRAAVEQGIATKETERVVSGVAAGHYLLAQPGSPFNTPVEGFQGAWQQRYVKGEITVNGKDVQKMFEAGEIDRRTYLAVTSTVRVYDPMRMAEYIRKHPIEGLKLLARITVRKAPSASLYAPKN